jgi:hypothetical protein
MPISVDYPSLFSVGRMTPSIVLLDLVDQDAD